MKTRILYQECNLGQIWIYVDFKISLSRGSYLLDTQWPSSLGGMVAVIRASFCRWRSWTWHCGSQNSLVLRLAWGMRGAVGTSHSLLPITHKTEERWKIVISLLYLLACKLSLYQRVRFWQLAKGLNCLFSCHYWSCELAVLQRSNYSKLYRYILSSLCLFLIINKLP